MASGRPATVSSGTGLEECDLDALYEILYPLSAKYKPIGLRIGLLISEIETIEAVHLRDPRKCLLEILSTRLKKSECLTWHVALKRH